MTPDLNHLMATEVMGWKIHPRNTAHWMRAADSDLGYRPVHFVGEWSPCTKIEHAWQIVEKFRRGDVKRVACCVELIVTDIATERDCGCVIYGPNTAKVVAWANEMPLAICLAALKTVGVTVDA